jgi:hypothetical protein
MASFALLAAACGDSVASLCEDLGEACGASVVDENQCRVEGTDLEEYAENEGCEPAFEEHLACVERAECSFATACDHTLEDLLVCVSGVTVD